jgi:3-deoxy-manno-octulosonate cytidylyltransferase (CMP-KDO synthetase)
VTSFGIVIPARLASTRLPEKPLLPIAGKPLVVWVLEAAQRSGADFVLVAADDQRIVDVVQSAGGEALLTSPAHTSGTDRLAEVADQRQFDDETILVNWQGDEPLLDPKVPALIAGALGDHPRAHLSTLATPITSVEDLFSPNVVKVVLDRYGFARTFSRAPVPWVRDSVPPLPEQPAALPPGVPFLRHIGLYAYRAHTLREITGHAPPSWETAESLEQLRALWLGWDIHVSVVGEAPLPGVDTDEDLERVRRALESA